MKKDKGRKAEPANRIPNTRDEGPLSSLSFLVGWLPSENWGKCLKDKRHNKERINPKNLLCFSRKFGQKLFNNNRLSVCGQIFISTAKIWA